MATEARHPGFFGCTSRHAVLTLVQHGNVRPFDVGHKGCLRLFRLDSKTLAHHLAVGETVIMLHPLSL